MVGQAKTSFDVIVAGSGAAGGWAARRFRWGDRGLFTIAGIAGDVHISALDADPPPMIYNSMFQVQSRAS